MLRNSTLGLMLGFAGLCGQVRAQNDTGLIENIQAASAVEQLMMQEMQKDQAVNQNTDEPTLKNMTITTREPSGIYVISIHTKNDRLEYHGVMQALPIHPDSIAQSTTTGDVLKLEFDGQGEPTNLTTYTKSSVPADLGAEWIENKHKCLKKKSFTVSPEAEKRMKEDSELIGAMPNTLFLQVIKHKHEAIGF